jgi:hypothetical protein
MICRKENPILLNAINRIIDNVKNKYYGLSCLEPTGPLLLGQYFSQEEKNSIIKHKINGPNDFNKIILFNNYPILRCFKRYHSEQEKYKIRKHYGQLWNERHVYIIYSFTYFYNL